MMWIIDLALAEENIDHLKIISSIMQKELQCMMIINVGVIMPYALWLPDF